jgi:hypothetical protein
MGPQVRRLWVIGCGARDGVSAGTGVMVFVTPSLKAKTECIPLCVPELSFTHKATNCEINSITSV